MSLQNSYLEKYRPQFDSVYGWCDEYLFDTIDLLSSQSINQKGGIAEIGIQDGKFFILLNQTVEPEYNSYAIDVFENQNLNIDKSGGGRIDYFKNHLQLVDRHHGNNTIIISGDSTDSALNLDKVIEPGSIKFFSIDGGHTPTHAMNDLLIASKAISNEGVVILDDILNHWHTGVLEGWVNFNSRNPSLVPFAMGHNKLYLCKISYHAFYLNLMNTINLNGPHSISKFFGWDVVKWRYWGNTMGW
jgi:hypothetical protein